MIEEIFRPKTLLVDEFLQNYLSHLTISANKAIADLRDSMVYSTMNGGKRFRPVLSLLVAEALGQKGETVLPFGACVELIHTYSLIHDDLPAMDDDDIRRGKPTNHKVYGEALALLAGDALLTESFLLLADNYGHDGSLLTALLRNVSTGAGIRGMVGGQAIDLDSQKNGQRPLAEELLELHSLKTSALIVTSITGAALICQASNQQTEDLELYGEDLGLAFQVADDLLDYDENNVEVGSLPGVYGFAESRKMLIDLTKSAINHLKDWDTKADPLRRIAEYNRSRKH